MRLTLDQIRAAAMQLTAREREALAEELLLSTIDVDHGSVETAWLAESRRRDADFLTSRQTASPADQVIDRLARRLQ